MVNRKHPNVIVGDLAGFFLLLGHHATESGDGEIRAWPVKHLLNVREKMHLRRL